MSFDLHFFAPANRVLSESDFDSFFEKRRHYSRNGSQAFYENEDTGVYFAFEHGSGTNPEDLIPNDSMCNAVAIFNLNFFRPHIFALEAIPEITAFINAFGLTVNDGSVQEPFEFSSDGFLREWNRGNSAGYKTLRDNPSQPLCATGEIERIWKWNLARGDYQDRFGETLFVPKVFYFMRQDRVCSGVVWPDAIPIALPRCDIVWVMRNEITPRSFFGLARGPSTDAIVSYTQVRALLANYPVIDSPAEHLLLQYDSPPAALVQSLNKFPPASQKPEAIPPDQVLNQELWDSAR